MRSQSSSKRLIFIIVVIVLCAAGGAWYYYEQYLPSQVPPPAEEIKTTQVRRGDLVIYASGSGTLVPAAEVDLGFRTSGFLAEMLAEVGDQVSAGDLLARQDDTDARSQVTQAEISLRQAELKLVELQREPDALDIEVARYNLASAEKALEAMVAGPTAADVEMAQIDLESAKLNLDQAYNNLWSAQAKRDSTAGNDRSSAGEIAAAEAAVANAFVSLDKSLGAYEQAKLTYDQKVAGPTEEQIAAAQARASASRAQLAKLLDGPTAESLESTQLQIELARQSLETARTKLDNTMLHAPFGGTVTEVKAQAGESVGTSAILTLADLNDPIIRIHIDETDMDKISVGYEVEVFFDAIPDKTFTGRIARVDPLLVTVEGVPSVRALAYLDRNPSDTPQMLLSGMNAMVDVIGGKAENALLVPVEALRELSPGSYSVFVMEDGQLQMRSVEVGLMDFSYAEIISGLKQGDRVSTGIVETK